MLVSTVQVQPPTSVRVSVKIEFFNWAEADEPKVTAIVPAPLLADVNVKVGTEISDEELLKANSNQSMVHVDFMFGNKDLQIEGTLHDGSKVMIFVDGDFVI